MKAKAVIVMGAVCLGLVACKKDEAVGASTAASWSDKASAGKDLFATIKTNQGSITAKLYSKETPKTVKNFVGLATGEREWRSPATGETKRGVPLYSGTIFHRVIDGFMIQGGDPLGTGTGNPGYQFEDEITARTFDREGLLAMANAGPATNGSQFFITTSKPTYLNGKHTIFGEVVKGYEVVQAISKVQRGPGDRPVQPVTIESITISEAP
jgi:peptidyl-prolyl cis-trans isomerase A (cyclophilin A)